MKHIIHTLAAAIMTLGLIATCFVSCTGKNDPKTPADQDDSKAPAGHEMVDLGLPSGTKWARTNIGSEKEHEIGLYFAWGETVGYGSDPKDGRTFLLGDYKWGDESYGMFGITKYQLPDGQDGSNGDRGCWYDENGQFIGDGKGQLDPEDDAAAVLWGSGWRMPTNTEIEELVANCNYELTTMGGVPGAKLTSKINGNYIFLPSCGDRGNGDIHWVGEQGYYWGSTVAKMSNALADMLYFTQDQAAYAHYARRFGGRNIRPVHK